MQACDASGYGYGACACATTPAAMSGAAPVSGVASGMQSAASAPTPATPAASATPPAPAMPAAPMMSAPMWSPFGAQSAMGASTPGSFGSAAGPGAGWNGDVPPSEHCASVALWNPQWVAFEEEVFDLTNEQRAQGATCGDYGPFPPAPPLAMNPMLRCSSRLHSMDMGENDYFAHDNQDGLDPFARMAAAGYAGLTMGENIAKGQQSPAEVLHGWMDSPGHCVNIMNPQYTELGVGFFAGVPTSESYNDNTLWTQNFGAPRGVAPAPAHCAPGMQDCNGGNGSGKGNGAGGSDGSGGGN
jgi:uncharacterized protein YkwD